MAKLRCVQCERALAECCDMYYPVMFRGKVTDDVVCLECSADLAAELAGDWVKDEQGTEYFKIFDDAVEVRQDD